VRSTEFSFVTLQIGSPVSLISRIYIAPVVQKPHPSVTSPLRTVVERHNPSVSGAHLNMPSYAIPLNDCYLLRGSVKSGFRSKDRTYALGSSSRLHTLGDFTRG
jgi:hypothetical protein